MPDWVWDSAPKAWSKFWWLRGALAALAFVGLVPTLFEIERYESLKIVHALIVGWNDWMADLGAFLSRYLPWSIGPISLNVITMLLTAAIPSIIFKIQSTKNRKIDVFEYLFMSKTKFLIEKLKNRIDFYIVFLLIISLFVALPKIDKIYVENSKISSVVKSVFPKEKLESFYKIENCLIYIDAKTQNKCKNKLTIINNLSTKNREKLFHSYSNRKYNLNHEEIILSQEASRWSLLISILLFNYIARCCFLSKAYGRGVFFIFTFIIVAEALYFMPGIGEWASSRADEILLSR